jgi:HD-GYP domain-containing protein (c-di-GMP phosphodiesterase class II)
MIASSQSAGFDVASVEDTAIDALPEGIVGIGEWYALSVRHLAGHFAAAVASGQSYRVANAVRAIARVPDRESLVALIEAVCNALAKDAFSRRDRRPDTVERIDAARRLAFEVLDEVSADRDRTPAVAQPQSDSIVAILGLVRFSRPSLAEHLAAVSALARRLASWMRLDPEVIESIAAAAVVHDVGQIAGNALTEDDREHVLAGMDYVAKIPSLAAVAPIVRAHHERFDGKGFPDELAAESIPIEARIIAVADAFHATAVTLGDSVLSLAAAIEEIRSGSGTRFDPIIVSAMTQLMRPNHRWKSRSA